jgi:lipoprotein-anchoring transpeptidase ErfK/SrfK
VRGVLSPATPGEKVVVRFHRGAKKLKAKTVTVRSDGSFLLGFTSARSGTVKISAVHRASPAMGTVKAAVKKVRVLRAAVSSGGRGPVVRLLQRGLAGLGYAVSRTGVYDDATARAVMAYRKTNRLERNFIASESVVRGVLAGKGAYKVRFPKAGHHVEADISRQVLALVDKGKVVRTYHISSGAPGTPTVLGHFRVYMKQAGTNAKGMVHSSYFIRGYAIHGYVSVPAFNASHGCLRVPIPNAASIFSWVKHGDAVITYRS